MQFIVEGRYTVEDGIAVRVPYIVISIRDPGRRPARIPHSGGLRGTLRLFFHDAEPSSGMTLAAQQILGSDHERVGFVLRDEFDAFLQQVEDANYRWHVHVWSYFRKVIESAFEAEARAKYPIPDRCAYWQHTKDNDTVAAIVGSAVGALHGRNGLPARWIENLLGRTTDSDDGRVFELLEAARVKWWSTV